MRFQLDLFGISLAVFLTKEHNAGGKIDDDHGAEIVDDHGDTELVDSDDHIPMGFAPSK